MFGASENGWAAAIVPLQVGVLRLPIPNAKRCYKPGKSLRKAIQSYPDDNLNVAIVATGGPSHQVHGKHCGFLNEDWDLEFPELLETNQRKLTEICKSWLYGRGGGDHVLDYA